MSKRIGVIVLIVIVLTCGGLLVQAIKKVKDAEARTQCVNNLKQIGLAIHNFHDTYRRCPSATCQSQVNLPVEKQGSWLMALWPFYESTPLVVKVDKPWDSPDNLTIGVLEISFFLCPANQKRLENGFGLTHYVGISGIGKDAINLPLDDPRAGFFGYYRQIKFSDIKDGLDNTIVAMEPPRDHGPWIKPGYATVRGLDPEDPPYLGQRGQFGSKHTETVLFADATVRFVSPAVSPRVLEGLATIAGGEEISKEWWEE